MVYLDVVMFLNFTVDFLLLTGTNRLCGYPPGIKRTLLAAGIGSAYAGACLLPGMTFLANVLWRAVCLGFMSVVAFGWSVSGLRRGIVFVVLSMALGGIALGMGTDGFWSPIAGAGMIMLLCAIGFRDKIGTRSYLPVELCYGEQHLHLTALRDTGNTLRDPITGKSVLVIGNREATRLTGLTTSQLEKPVQTMSASLIPGLRLVPYRSVGQTGGLLLALRIPEVTIGTWKGSALVAFSPSEICEDGAYQALTGGVV